MKMSAYGFKNSFKNSLPKVLTLCVLVAFSHFCLGAKVLDSISQNPALQNDATQDSATTDSTPIDSTLIESANSQDFADSIISRVQSVQQDSQTLQSSQPPIIAQILNRTQFYGHIGTFGKSSFGKNRDSYLTLHFAANLSYDFYAKNDHLLNATIGIWGLPHF